MLAAAPSTPRAPKPVMIIASLGSDTFHIARNITMNRTITTTTTIATINAVLTSGLLR